jgi:ribosomal protein L24
MERDITVQILQKTLEAPSGRGILSAFCRDAIKGSVYIESNSIADDIRHVLNTIPGVVRSREGRYHISLVEIQDRHLLLSMDVAGVNPPIKNHAWVRMKRGLYRGDLGLVKYIERATLTCDTLFVPRILMGPKRKRGNRPPPLLFNPKAIDEAFGKGAAEKRNRCYAFKGNIFCDGFIEKNIHMTDLYTEGINVTDQELEPFRRISELWDKSDPFMSPIRVGDWVRVVSGSFIGMVGEIVEVLAMTVRVSGKKKDGGWEDIDDFVANGKARRPNWGNSQGETREVLTRDIRKAFETGDFVQVIHGEYRGLEGFLVRLDADFVTIYVLPSNSTDPQKKAGSEVSRSSYILTKLMITFKIRAKFSNVDWKSSAHHFFDHTNASSSVRTKFDPTHPEGLPYTALDPLLELSKKTVDRYKHMEVRILKGDAKRNFGVIKGTHKSLKGEELVEVQTSTKAINTAIAYRVEDLQERL